MKSVSFLNIGKSIVLSDLHLNTLSGSYENIQFERIKAIIEDELPDAIILNGDTFDLFFDMSEDSPNGGISKILQANSSLVRLFAKVNRVFFLAGAHDQALRYDYKIRDTILEKLPNCSGFYDCIVDHDNGVVVIPGSQFYYDNVVGDSYISLTEELTSAFREFLLSGYIEQSNFIQFYLEGRLGFWYRTGNHYQFLLGLANAFNCDIKGYFDRIAKLCSSERFIEWTVQQFYDDYKTVAHLAQLIAIDGGSAMESMAPSYWRILGRTVNERLNLYMEKGVLDYPPYKNIGFQTAIIGYNHLVRNFEHPSGRRIIYTGSTKPQTKIYFDRLIAETEIGGGYAIIDEGKVSLIRLTTELQKLDLKELRDQHDCSNTASYLTSVC